MGCTVPIVSESARLGYAVPAMDRRFVAQHGPTRVVFGSRDDLPAEITRLGCQRVLVVGTPGRKDDLEQVERALGGKVVATLATAAQHVPRALAEDAQAVAAHHDADAVLAIGGGSAIGLAKAVALAGRARMIALPTTYAGSEMTSIYGITDGGEKRTGKDDRVRAALVLYDPRATLGLPLEVTIASLWNAMAHAIQALWSPVDAITRRGAEAGLQLIASALPRLSNRPDDLAARTDALEGAYHAGAALSVAGTGLHHQLCHVLGGSFGLPHAATHAAVLPHVVHYNRDVAADALARVARALDTGGAEFGLAKLAKGRPTLAALGLKRDDVDGVIAAVMTKPAPNPRGVTAEGLRDLLLGALGAA